MIPLEEGISTKKVWRENGNSLAAYFIGEGEQGDGNVRDRAVDAANRKGRSGQGRRGSKPGKPCALKGARTVWEEAAGKGLSSETIRRDFWQVWRDNGTSPTAYFIKWATTLALTQIQADAKGHYPYVIHPEQGYQALPNVNMRQIAQRASIEDEADDTTQTIPSLIEYSQVKASIPQGHALVGISARGIETREDSVRALVWVVGSSGVGKTNSVSIRVDDDYERGHRFLGIDPHAFKVDSLTNALKAYQSRFLMPIAQKTEDINQVLDAFLGEFDRRKNGGTWKTPITLIVDEVGSMVMDIDKEEQAETDVARKLKMVARICGQESRGFEMYGIYISQDAAGLAWLRKRALMR